MRIRTGLLTLSSLLLAAGAQAGPLPFTGSFAIEFSTAPPIAFPVAGTATLNGSGGLGALSSLTLAEGSIAGSAAQPITDPAAAPIKGLLLHASNGAGTFSLDGLMALPGAFMVCLFGPCASAVANIVVPFTQNGTRGVGLGGGPLTSMGLVNSTVQGSGWTVGTAVVPGFYPMTRMGFVHGPASGGASSAAAVSGVVQLVTPIAVYTNLGPDLPVVPLFGMLTIQFVPEPATLLMVTSGLAILGALARRRREQP